MEVGLAGTDQASPAAADQIELVEPGRPVLEPQGGPAFEDEAIPHWLLEQRAEEEQIVLGGEMGASRRGRAYTGAGAPVRRVAAV